MLNKTNSSIKHSYKLHFVINISYKFSMIKHILICLA